jgi:hypothetical protein
VDTCEGWKWRLDDKCDPRVSGAGERVMCLSGTHRASEGRELAADEAPRERADARDGEVENAPHGEARAAAKAAARAK